MAIETLAFTVAVCLLHDVQLESKKSGDKKSTADNITDTDSANGRIDRSRLRLRPQETFQSGR